MNIKNDLSCHNIYFDNIVHKCANVFKICIDINYTQQLSSVSGQFHFLTRCSIIQIRKEI